MVTIVRDSLGAEKGLKTLERQREGDLWLGRGLRTKVRSCVSQGGHARKSSDSPQVLLD